MFSRSLMGKNGTQLKNGRLRSGAHCLPDHRDSKESEHHGRNRGDEFDVGLDQALLTWSGDFTHIDRCRNAERHGEKQRDGRDQNRSDQQRNNAIPILPETRRDPFPAKKKRADRAIPGNRPIGVPVFQLLISNGQLRDKFTDLLLPAAKLFFRRGRCQAGGAVEKSCKCRRHLRIR